MAFLPYSFISFFSPLIATVPNSTYKLCTIRVGTGLGTGFGNGAGIVDIEVVPVDGDDAR